MAVLRRRHAQIGQAVGVQMRAAALLAAARIAVQIDEDGEQPGAQGTAGTKQASAGYGALQTILHQIIGVVDIARQRAGVAAQGRHAGFELIEKIDHAICSLLAL